VNIRPKQCVRSRGGCVSNDAAEDESTTHLAVFKWHQTSLYSTRRLYGTSSREAPFHKSCCVPGNVPNLVRKLRIVIPEPPVQNTIHFVPRCDKRGRALSFLVAKLSSCVQDSSETRSLRRRPLSGRSQPWNHQIRRRQKSNEQGCYSLQKAVTTCNSAKGTGGKLADASLSADLQVDQSKNGGKLHSRIVAFALDFRVIAPLKLVGIMSSPA
jgi:hypothetical protein